MRSKLPSILREWFSSRVLAVALSVVLLGVLLALGGWFWREHRFLQQWKAHQAGLAASGIPTSANHLLSPAPDPENNAALDLLEAVELHQRLLDHGQFKDFVVAPPGWKDKLSDAAWRSEMLQVWQTPEALRVVELVRAAAEKPSFFVQRDWANPLAMSLEPTTSLLQLAQWLSMQAAVWAHEGRPADALEMIRLTFRLADLAQAEPLLICFLVGTAIEGLALNSLEILGQTPGAYDLAPEVSTRLERVLAVREKRVFPNAIRALDGERILFADFLFASLRGGKSAPALLQTIRDSLGEGQSSWDAAWLGLAGWAYQYPFRFSMDADQLAMAKFHQALRTRFAKPFDRGGVLLSHQPGDLLVAIPKSAILTKITVPALDGVFVTASVQVERLRMARLAVLVWQFRLAEGRWPGSAEELRIFQADAPILDCFSGQPYVWETSGERLKFSSSAFEWPDDKLAKNRRRGLSWTF